MLMARQYEYVGCPAISASVERLFSQVKIASANKRKGAELQMQPRSKIYHFFTC